MKGFLPQMGFLGRSWKTDYPDGAARLTYFDALGRPTNQVDPGTILKCVGGSSRNFAMARVLRGSNSPSCAGTRKCSQPRNTLTTRKDRQIGFFPIPCAPGTPWFSKVFQAYPGLVKANQTMHPLHGNRASPKHCSFASRIGGREQQRLGLERRGQNLDPFDRLTGFCGSNRLAPISLQLDGSGKLGE